MGVKSHHIFTSFLVIGLFLIIAFSDVQTGVEYNPNSWVGMSIALGASVLTVVGIITSVITGNENDRRAEFIDIQNRILHLVVTKERTIQESNLKSEYNKSIEKIKELIEERSPLKYTESYVGFLSFISFIISVVLVIYGMPFKFIFLFFIEGVALIIGYIFFCMVEFKKMDEYLFEPIKKGSMKLSEFKINDIDCELLDNTEKSEKVILISDRINELSYIVNFNGIVRNGLLHTIITYDNEMQTHIPDNNTFLMNMGFINDYQLAVYGGEDTGILNDEESLTLSYKIPLRIPKNEGDNIKIAEPDFSYLGKQEIFQYPSIPDDFTIKNIVIRIYEDPFYRPNYKRREISKIVIRVVRTQTEPQISIKIPKKRDDKIIEIYNGIIKDFRLSIKNITFEFKARYGFVDRNFNIIKGYFTDSTMSAVEGYDPELYTKLKRLTTDLDNELENWENKRRSSLTIIKENWIIIIENTETNIDVKSFVNGLFSSVIWEIWRGNYDLVKTMYGQNLDGLQYSMETAVLPPNSTIDKLINTAVATMNVVKDAFILIEVYFEEIESDIIPTMEETIKDQFG